MDEVQQECRLFDGVRAVSEDDSVHALVAGPGQDFLDGVLDLAQVGQCEAVGVELEDVVGDHLDVVGDPDPGHELLPGIRCDGARTAVAR